MLSSVKPNQEIRKDPAILPVGRPDPNRIAVLVNRNAKRVNDRLAKRMERLVGSDHLFYSRSLDEAEAFCREIVQRGYGTIISGGGDGTLCGAINLVQRYVRESNAWRVEQYKRYGEVQSLLGMPRFGFLRLGTGNGVTTVVGAGNPMRDLKTIVDYAPGRTHTMPLIEHQGDQFFFCGMGYDSMILNDYAALRDNTKSRLLAPLVHNLTGYFAAVLTRTLPRTLFSNKGQVEARVVTRGPAFYIDPRRGDAAVEIEPGTTLFEGKASMIGAGTAPFYGFGLKIFPFANTMPNMMQLRIAKIGSAAALLGLPKIWRGTYRNPAKLFDFFVRDVAIELAQPYPFQHSGDDKGNQDRVDLRVADEPLRLVDLYPPRPAA